MPRHISIAILTCGQANTALLGGCVVDGRASEGLVLEALARCTHRTTRTRIVDIQNVERMDAASIGILPFMYGEARPLGVCLSVQNPSSFLNETFRTTGLEKSLLPPVAAAGDAA